MQGLGCMYELGLSAGLVLFVGVNPAQLSTQVCITGYDAG